MTQATIKQETSDLTSSSKEVYFTDLLSEIQLIPQEYWANLLQILRSFREVTNPGTEIPINNNATNNIVNIDPSEQMKKNQVVLELLRHWREDDDDLENQKETWEILSTAFDIND